MAYCKRCGAEIYDDTYICPRCGVQQRASADSGSILWALLGFLIPLIGLILFLVWHDEKPQSARMAGIGALAGVLFDVAFYVIIVMVWGIALFSTGTTV